jgi:hypothetical protein
MEVELEKWVWAHINGLDLLFEVSEKLFDAGTSVF